MSEPGRAPSVSRRSFLGRAGVAASGVALLGEVGLATATEEPTIAGLGVVAIALTVNGRACEVSVQPRAAVVLGAAAPVPWRARQAEAALVGQMIDPAMARAAGQAAIAGAAPLRHNADKLPILAALVRRAELQAAGTTDQENPR